MVGVNLDLQAQMALLEKILALNAPLWHVLEKASVLGLRDYYIGAGCVTQTIWNYQTGNDLNYGISDIDFVYYDHANLSFEAEDAQIQKITSALSPCQHKLDIKNQARVHLWYKDHFGYGIEPYGSIESAINSWPTVATAVGVRLENNTLRVYAPFGLNDLFGMVVRPNKAQITEDIYRKKTMKWYAKWPALTIIPW